MWTSMGDVGAKFDSSVVNVTVVPGSTRDSSRATSERMKKLAALTTSHVRPARLLSGASSAVSLVISAATETLDGTSGARRLIAKNRDSGRFGSMSPAVQRIGIRESSQARGPFDP